MTAARRLLAVALVFLGASLTPVAAQETSKLVRLVPDDFGFVLAVHDLRDQFERWEKSPWLGKIKGSKLVQQLLKSDELGQLLKTKHDLEKHLEVDWPTLRDDVVGDALVLAYRPGPAGKPTGEEGLLLLRPRKVEVVVKLLDRLNALQKKSGELKELAEREHRGVKYILRLHDKSKQFYFVRDGLLAFGGDEEIVKGVINRVVSASGANLWSRALERASTPRSFATVLVNPRPFDGEFKGGAGKPDDLVKAKIGEVWQALDALALNVRMEEALELRVTLLAREKDGGAAVKEIFQPGKPSPLWAHFPERAILTVTGQIDLAPSGVLWKDVLPVELRKVIETQVLPFKLEKDVLPHLGPDWGLSVFSSDDDKRVPQVVLALAARPGAKGADKAVYDAMCRFVASVTLFQPDLRLQTVMQDRVEVTYLESDKLFPAGFQPALALKDGYLLLASSPEGIERFRTNDAFKPRKDENLFFRLSATELAKQVDLRRDFLVEQIAKAAGNPRAGAELIDIALDVLHLFDRIELAESTTRDQLTVILRVSP